VGYVSLLVFRCCLLGHFVGVPLAKTCSRPWPWSFHRLTEWMEERAGHMFLRRSLLYVAWLTRNFECCVLNGFEIMNRVYRDCKTRLWVWCVGMASLFLRIPGSFWYVQRLKLGQFFLFYWSARLDDSLRRKSYVEALRVTSGEVNVLFFSSGATVLYFESLVLVKCFLPFNSVMDSFCPIIYFHNPCIFLYHFSINCWFSC
jgi:hypothetical protein